MQLFWTLLPLYVMGNFHCIGMCGPIAVLLGNNPCKHYYLLGRITSFTLAGFLSAAIGSSVSYLLFASGLDKIFLFLFSLIFFLVGSSYLAPSLFSPPRFIAQALARIQRFSAPLLLADSAWKTFLFGFLTVLLPCGQSLFVFSTLALEQNLITGAFNGWAFALLTTPSLFITMHAGKKFVLKGTNFSFALGILSIIAAALTFLRGLSQIGQIPSLSFSFLGITLSLW